MAKLLQVLGLTLIYAYAANALYPRQIQDTVYAGGQFVHQGRSAHYCIRYCRKLGDCWGVDYFRFSRRCAVHLDDTRCAPARRRHYTGADHFRVKECREKTYKQEPIDTQVAELRARLDAKDLHSNCLMNIYEASYARGGTLFATNLSLTRCTMSCLSSPGCRTVNYRRESGNCYHFTKPFTVSTLVTSQCCHHVSISCYHESPTTEKPPTTPTTVPDSSPTKEPYQYHHHHYHYHRRRSTTTQGPSTESTSNHPTGHMTYPTVLPSTVTYPTTKKHSGYPKPDHYQHYPHPYHYYPHYHYHKDTGKRPTTTLGPSTTTNYPPTSHVTYRSVTPSTVTPSTVTLSTVTVPTPTAMTTATPDDEMDPEVCPFLRQDGTSRSGGIIVPEDVGVATPGECRDWCEAMNEAAGMVVCYGADWNTETDHCFTFDTEPMLDMMNYTDKYIIHYMYNPCDSIPALQCTVHGPVDASQDTVVLGPLGAGIAHTSEPCDGFCTYSYSFNIDNVGTVTQQLERGCGSGDDLRWRQCAGPPPTRTSLSTTCHCRGDNCNAMGFGGLYNLHAHYPFDYNADDISGFNRHGRAVGAIKYSTLDKRSPKTAALFDGRSYVEVDGMSLVHMSQVLSEGEVQVSAAVALWVKRMSGTAGPMTVLSDAATRAQSTLSIYSDLSMTDDSLHTVTVGIRVENVSYTATSPEMPVGEWQFVVLNVVGSVSPPELRLYMSNGSPTTVSPVATTVLPDTVSSIDVSSQTLTVGKQSGPDLLDPFVGGLDELRFFQSELSEDDIGVLEKMFNYDP